MTSGAEIAPYLKAFKTDLFLSANSDDVQSAINDGIAAGRILKGDAHADPKQKINQIRIAFDGDAVLFSAESEKIFQKNGIQAFEEYEKANANTPMAKGPFANFLTKLSYVQQLFKEKNIQPIRTALVTSRNAPAHERAVKTLRNWGVSINEAFFLGGVSKTEVLAASFKNSQQVLELCEYGIGAATIAPDVIEGLIKNASVTSAVEAFTSDFEGLCGEGKTMENC